MTAAQQIEDKVNLIGNGTVFSIEDLQRDGRTP